MIFKAWLSDHWDSLWYDLSHGVTIVLSDKEVYK